VVARADPVGAYARQVVTGKAPAGELMKLACQRHLDDVKRWKKASAPYQWDPVVASDACGFFKLLRHSKGQWAGQVFELAPWQVFVVGSVFGWLRKDGVRRFRTAYMEVARKNGKTTLAAGVAIQLGFFDGEPGAEVFFAATKRDQAKITFEESKRMVSATPSLKAKVESYVGSLTAGNSKLQPLGADADTMDGLNIHGAVVDELHAHKTRAIVDVLETATGARRQPLIFYTTTAGFDRETVCWELHEYTEKIFRGVVKDETWFGFIAAADEDDDWRAEATWRKANPNYGVSVLPDDLKRKCDKAKELPGAQNSFRRLHTNLWTESHTAWIPDALWMENAGERDPTDIEDALEGAACWCGLDLGSTSDFCSFVAVFPDESGGYDVLARFWIPEPTFKQRLRSARGADLFFTWREQGHLVVTPGASTDYDFIEDEILRFAERFQVRAIAYDRYAASQLVKHLETELGEERLIAFGQGYVSMSAPCKELERLSLQRKIRHGGHPVLRWMCSNVSLQTDPAGNIKIDKARSAEKVDGMVSLAEAIGALTLVPDTKEPEESYEVTWV